MSTELMLHRGARPVTRDELAAVPVPPSTKTWFPLSHASVLDRAEHTLVDAGFQPSKVSLALSADRARFFGIIDLTTIIRQGVSLTVGIRNSIDRSLPVAFTAGNRVTVCDNLAFHGEIVVARKHTKFCETRFGEAIARAVGSLNQFKEAEAERIAFFQQQEISNDTADAAVIDAIFSQGVTPLSAADVFDQTTPGDLLNLDQMLLNLSNLTVKNGTLSLS